MEEDIINKGCGKWLDIDETTKCSIYCGTNDGQFLCDECRDECNELNKPSQISEETKDGDKT